MWVKIKKAFGWRSDPPSITKQGFEPVEAASDCGDKQGSALLISASEMYSLIRILL